MNALLSILLVVTSAFYPQSAKWLEQAEASKPALHHTLCTPVRMVEPHADNTAFQGWRYDASPVTVSEACSTTLRPGQVFTFDFGRHMVGYLTLNTRTLRRCQDAPTEALLAHDVRTDTPTPTAMPVCRSPAFDSVRRPAICLRCTSLFLRNNRDIHIPRRARSHKSETAWKKAYT